MKKRFYLVALALISLSATLLHTNWQTDKNTRVNFKIKGMFGLPVNGTISGLQTSILFYPDHPEKSQIEASILPYTIHTKNKKRDKHLRSADYFAVERFPQIRFVSRSFRQIGEYYVAEGELTVKDSTRAITIPFEFIQNGDSAIFKGDFSIKRLDFGLGKKSWMIGNEVEVHLHIPVKAS